MVHNGIEYGIMQLLAETYDLLHHGLDLTNDEMGDLFDQWKQAELNGYLVEITTDIFRKVDDKTGKQPHHPAEPTPNLYHSVHQPRQSAPGLRVGFG